MFTPKEYAWLGDKDRAMLMERELNPEEGEDIAYGQEV